MNILCIGTTPAAQRVMVFSQLKLDEVNRASTTLDGAAGKSINVAKVLQVLGADPLALGFLGGPRGQQLRALLDARGLRHEFTWVGAPTRECVTVIDQHAGTVTELVEESHPIESAAYRELLTLVQNRVVQCRAMVLSGTIASGGPSDLYSKCTALAHRAGALSVLDASGQALLQALSARPGLVKPNRAELEKTIGYNLQSEAALRQAIEELHSQGAQRVVITAGASPALAYDGRSFCRITAPRVQVLNPIGSGDAFTAAATWRLVLGDNLGDACRWGAAAGAANALTAMAGEIHRSDVDRLVNEVQVENL